MRSLTLLLAVLFFPWNTIRGDVPDEYFTVSGHIRDASSGEELIGAALRVKGTITGTVSNTYGFYSISLPPGTYILQYSYIGYQPVDRKIELNADITLDIELEELSQEIDEVVIRGELPDRNVTSTEMSVEKISIRQIRRIPALMGEVDLIRAVQLLPGIQATSEGSTGFSVRGGSYDQNLILLDEATVYNAAHLLGFFSIFNNDAVKDVEVYKGDIPARYGGRISSLLDVRMKDGNLKEFTGTGGIGLISSRLTLEMPLIRDKSSAIFSGRRTYLDLFLPLSGEEAIRNSKLFFYDLNAKANYIINDNNRIFLSGYFGKDVFKNEFAGFSFGNSTGTLRWNHLFSKKLFSNFTLIASHYSYQLGTPEGEANSFEWTSDLNDLGLKADLSYYINPSNTLRFGASSLFHKFEPGRARGTGDQTLFNEFVLPDNHALEHGVYISNEQKIGAWLRLKYGLRLSMFQNIGSATIYRFEDYEPVDSVTYPSGEIFNSYHGWEPRLGATFILNPVSSIKASYSRAIQYIQLASNSTAGTPLDVWFPASPNVEPQIGDQWALGYFRNFRSNTIETSVEAYYKHMQHVIDFKDHARILLNPQLEGEIRTGQGWSYGLEWMVRLNDTRLNGWISYTLSRSMREVPAINKGDPYPSPYDRPHDISIVLNYELWDVLILSANWVYATGQPVTFPTGRFEYQGNIMPVYSGRNAYRLPDYHRLDLSVTYIPGKKKERKWESEWNLSVYNAYARKNAWSINFVQDEMNPEITYAEKTYLFSVVPSLTYNFKF